MTWTTPRTWVQSENVTPALLNAQVRDNLSALSTWSPYTPVWTATSAPAIGDGSLTGRYLTAGGLCHFTLRLAFGSTTTGGTGTWAFTLPVTAVGYGVPTTHAVDAGTARHLGFSQVVPAATTFNIWSPATPSGWNATAPFTWTNTDYLIVAGTYEC